MKVVGKRTLLLFLTLVLTVGLVAFVWAEAPKGPAKGGPQGAPEGMMWHGHHGFMNLTPDQAGKIFDAKEKFRNDTAALRKQLFVGRAEMAALWKAENPDEKAIEGKLKELMDLRAQFMTRNWLSSSRFARSPLMPSCTVCGVEATVGATAVRVDPEWRLLLENSRISQPLGAEGPDRPFSNALRRTPVTWAAGCPIPGCRPRPFIPPSQFSPAASSNP